MSDDTARAKVEIIHEVDCCHQKCDLWWKGYCVKRWMHPRFSRIPSPVCPGPGTYELVSEGMVEKLEAENAALRAERDRMAERVEWLEKEWADYELNQISYEKFKNEEEEAESDE